MAEVVRHVLTYTANVAAIVEGTAAGNSVVKDPPGALRPDQQQSFEGLRDELVRASADFLSLPGRLPEPANLDVTVPHASFGELNCRSWFLFPRIHDSDHTQHLQALKKMDGFPV